MLLFVPGCVAGMFAVQAGMASANLAGTDSPSPREKGTVGVQSTVLGIAGPRFTVNGRPTFLLGISCYGALGAPQDFLRADLDELQRLGFNWLRVWATWEAYGADVSAVNAQGAAREPFLSKLQSLVAECDRRGLIMDVTLTRKRTSDGHLASGGLADLPSHQKAVGILIDALKSHRNWYLDLANEHDVHDERYVSPTELKELRDLARHLDPALLVTASFGGHDLDRNDVRDALVFAGLDFLCPHRPRNPKSASQTETMTRACLEMAETVQHAVPVQYQEPFRRGYGSWEPNADDFLADLRGAVLSGAAGWCFHNGSQRNSPDGRPRRSFDLGAKRLFEQLDPEERRVCEQASGVMKQSTAAEPPKQ